MLPELSGFEVCEYMRSRPELRDVPILVMSARAKPMDRAFAEEVGATAYLIKPFQPRELLPAIAGVLARARQDWAIEADELEHSSNGAEDKIATRRLVDEAKQTLMDRDDMPEDEAFGFIQRTAMRTRARMRDVAQQVVDGTLTP